MKNSVAAGINSGIVKIFPFLLMLPATKLVFQTIFIYFLIQNTTIWFTLNSHFKVHILTFAYPLCLFDLISIFPLWLHKTPRLLFKISPSSLPLSASPRVSAATFHDFSFLLSLCIQVSEDLQEMDQNLSLANHDQFHPLKTTALAFPVLQTSHPLDSCSSSSHYSAWLPSLQMLLEAKFVASAFGPGLVAITASGPNLIQVEVLWTASAHRALICYARPSAPSETDEINKASPLNSGTSESWIVHCTLGPLSHQWDLRC